MNRADNAGKRERWLRRAERVSDAFGIVLLLMLVTYVLASLLSNRGWPAVVLTLATSATSVVALVSSHANARLVRTAIGPYTLGSLEPGRWCEIQVCR